MTEIASDPTRDFSRLELPVHVIGVGAGGSDTVRTLVKGCFRGQLTIWDGDYVEEKNMRNQTYVLRHVGIPKVQALSSQMDAWGACAYNLRQEYFEGMHDLSGVVFLCVDDMDVRKDIWESSIKGNSNINLLIEMRMDGVNIMIHTLDPSNQEHQQEWDNAWYPQTKADPTLEGCGGPTLVLQCASIASDLATLQLMKYMEKRRGSGEGPWNQIRMSLHRMTFESYRW